MQNNNTARCSGAVILVLGALGFLLGSCEYVSVVILPEVAADLRVSLDDAGRLVSIFAASYAAGTPLLTAATGRLPRFRLLMGLMALFLAANAGCMLAPSLGVLYLFRGLAAVSVGTATAAAQLFAGGAVPPERRVRAVTAVYTGMGLSTIVGNPLNKALCALWGWRASFALIVLAGAALLPFLSRVLPHDLRMKGAAAGAGQFAVLRDRRYLLSAAMTVCGYAASYTVYTYLTPILTDMLHLQSGALALVLTGVGLCCTGSNLLGGWLGGRGGVERTPAVLALQALVLCTLPWLLGSAATGLAAVGAMCLLLYFLASPVQLYTADLAERSYPASAGLCAATLSVAANIGIAAGSLLASLLRPVLGLRLLGLPAAALALAALGLNLALRRERRGIPHSALCAHYLRI
ncbi:MAG: MFS transporter [Oscillibacter sp.]|nr:MFS transporter [Oscillibacter sp.]